MDTEPEITVALPSLIHRMGGEKVKKARDIAATFDCELKRIRRSRNWQLLGHFQALAMFSEHIRATHSGEFDYLSDKLESKLEQFLPKETTQEKLSRLIRTNPAITLAELMAETDCTMAEARSARFEQENL